MGSALQTMKPDQVDEVLRQTLDDARLSRSERKVLTALFAEHADYPARLDLFRHRAFAIAREGLSSHRDRQLLDWLEEVVKALGVASGHPEAAPRLAEAFFSPGDSCLRRIVSLIRSARRSIEICVFTITDDRIANALLDAHARAVTLRIISDDEKVYDQGSDIERLAREGIAVRVDGSEYHMHHKFALFDRSLLVTGSYNWTRAAAKHNEENIVVTSDERLLRSFATTFDGLWREYEPFAPRPR